MKKTAVFMPLAAGTCWGASGIFVRTLRAADFNNITIMFSRAIVGFVLLFVFLMIHDRSLLRIRLCDLPVFLSAAINGYLLMNTCYNLTVESLTLSLASVLLGLCPIFVLLLGAVFFREKITPLKVSCMLTALCGCMLISGVFDSTSDVAWSIAGIATGLGSAFFNAIYTINSKQLTERKYDVLTINLYVFMLTAACLLPFADLSMITDFVCSSSCGGTFGILFFLAQALITSIAPNYLYTASIRYIDSSKAAILSCGAEPVSALILGIFIYSEFPTFFSILGMIITISALVLLTKADRS